MRFHCLPTAVLVILSAATPQVLGHNGQELLRRIKGQVNLQDVPGLGTLSGRTNDRITRKLENDHCLGPSASTPSDPGKVNNDETLPDCPAWCHEEEYCDLDLLVGEEVEKYETDFLIPPVLINDRGKPTQHVVALRQFNQDILPNKYGPTKLWGYGDPELPNSFHNPAGSIEVVQNKDTDIIFLNDLVKNPECRCNGDTCTHLEHILQDCAGFPIVDTQLHWANPKGHEDDDLYNCANHDHQKEVDCTGQYPYVYDGPTPTVVHVHGAHAPPPADGYTEAWFTPNDYTYSGTWHEKFGLDFDPSKKICEGGHDSGLEANTYTNDQTTSTLFFHDHSLGMTRLNVYASGAGFYFIRTQDGGESGLKKNDVHGNKQQLPGPQPTEKWNPTKYWKIDYLKMGLPIPRELPIAFQDMSFYWDPTNEETRVAENDSRTPGRQFYPANHDYFLDETGEHDPTRWACNTIHGNDAFEYNHHMGKIWNPEVFFDVAVVNGRAWPKHAVAPDRYRLRLLNACDSRALSLSLWAWNPEAQSMCSTGIDGNPDSFEELRDCESDGSEEIPIWVIGTEQSLLANKPVKVQMGKVTSYEPCEVTCSGRRQCDAEPSPIDEETTNDLEGLNMMVGERYDVIVDFTGLELGTRIYVVNTGPNAPFGGFPPDGDFGVDETPWNTLGQLMRFDVSPNVPIADDPGSTDPINLCFDQNPGGVAWLDEPTSTPTRKVYLKEEDSIGGSLGPFAAVLNNEFNNQCEEGKGWAAEITETPKLGKHGFVVEEWDVVNLSADAHPIHVHQVKFEVVSRRPNTEEELACNGDCDTTAEAHPVLGYEKGWKDTVIAYPCETTTIRMKFDLEGLYVWHCHILSHEDNEMMRPMCVGDGTASFCCDDPHDTGACHPHED